MTTTTNVEKVKLNIMTQSQYNSATKNANELYMLTDAKVDYNDLSNKPTIPTVNNATLTITQGGTTKGTFTANASSDVTIDLDAGGGGGGSYITGMIIPYDGSAAPGGWLLCDGSAVSRTTYADLFDVIGTTYGAGDGSTTFNVPSANDFPIGYPSTSYSSVTLGASGTVYTATKNGWYSLSGQAASNGQFIQMRVNSSSGARVQQVYALTGQWIALSYPVRKGDKICVEYSNSISTLLRFLEDSGRASIIKT